jgi:hypothetical protein
MCCNTRGDRPAVLGLLQNIDPKVPCSSKFWRASTRDRKVSTVTVQAALDAAFTKACESPHWRRMSADDRLLLHTQFLTVRGNADLSSSAVEALYRYSRGLQHGTGKRVAAVVAAGLAAVTLGVSVISPAAAAAYPDNIAVQVRKGKCPNDWHMHVAGKPMKVSWAKSLGAAKKSKTVVKTIKKGKKYCAPGVVMAEAGASPTVNAQGEITALPKGFPKNPTPSDIKNLNWGWNSKVATSVNVPKPEKAIAPARTADSLSVTKTFGAQLTGADAYGADQYKVDVEFTIVGGSGVLDLYGAAAPVTLTGGTVVFRQTVDMASIYSPAPGAFSGVLQPDYGQANLPRAVSQFWVFGRERTGKVALNADGERASNTPGSFTMLYNPVTQQVVVRN